MQPDYEGFNYSVIDSQTCIKCGLCESVCPMLNFDDKIKPLNYPKVYGGWILDEEIRQESSSGRIFTALAEAVFSSGG